MSKSDDTVSRQAAIDLFLAKGMITAAVYVKCMPSAEPERTEYMPDTKAVRSKRDCVDLAERVTATFYDQEHEEWTQQTVTIADVLDSVCDEYTILPAAEPEIIWCNDCEWFDDNMFGCKYPRNGASMKAYDFCSKAERREE